MSVISCDSAPEAIAIGQAARIARRHAAVPGKSTADSRTSDWKSTVLRSMRAVHPIAVHAQALVPRQRLEHAHVVEAKIAAVVLVGREAEAVLVGEHLIDAQVQRLGVREHAVEIEDHRVWRHPAVPEGEATSFVFSPARTGTWRRFSRGGIGQS